jgi:hypothetical protein
MGAAGLFALIGTAASAVPLAGASRIGPSSPLAENPLATTVDFVCGPGYHLGWGGRRCWPNGWAPAEEIPPGFVPPPREPQYVYAPPPVLECPPGYRLGRGLRRCWPE